MIDYEKAYKAVLKTATQWIKDGCTDKEKNCLECVFPELRESEDERIIKFLKHAATLDAADELFQEYGVKHTQVTAWLKKQKECFATISNTSTNEDERIRKELIDFIQWAEDRGMTRHDFHQAKRPAEWIAYLEKQKINTEGDFGRGYDCGYEACLNSHGAEWFEKQKHPNGCFTCDEYKKGYEEGRRNGFTAGYNKAMKEMEQKEQKPVEVKDPFSNANFVRGYESGYADAKREQKPDTRDCDDLQLLGFVYDLLNEIEWNDNWAMSKEECLRRLNNYRPQKPAEWSEEDETMINSCISSIEEAKENRYAYKETDGDTSYDHEIAWLKSLRGRPKSSDNWKPSEEQLKALLNAEEYLREGDQFDSAKSIAQLYEQLTSL